MTSHGTQILATGNQLQRPADPFGTKGLVRYQTALLLSRMFDPTTAPDDFVVVEAGMPYPLAEDQDGDGVPDVTDNDGDGDVDDDDGDDLKVQPDPTDPADPRFLVTRVVPETWPEGFANPILIDVTGDGWVAPGLHNK